MAATHLADAAVPSLTKIGQQALRSPMPGTEFSGKPSPQRALLAVHSRILLKSIPEHLS